VSRWPSAGRNIAGVDERRRDFWECRGNGALRWAFVYSVKNVVTS